MIADKMHELHQWQNEPGFEGPYKDIKQIKDLACVYVVICHSGLNVLYIGTSGEGMYPDSQGGQRRIKRHEGKDRWREFCMDDDWAYAVKYIPNQKERHDLEKELHKKYKPPFSSA